MNLVPSVAIAETTSYAVPRHPAAVDMRLDGNEGPCPPAELLSTISDAELLRRYPDARQLEQRISDRLGVDASQVLVTAGADDALDRACRALLCRGRELVLPVPTFEMLPRYARWTGASVRCVPANGEGYPRADVLAAVSPRTAAIAVVSPNNPTGSVATLADLEALSEAAPNAALLVDGAYAEFADDDLTDAALALPNALVFRTFSKAWGLAGLRVGYVVGPAWLIDWLRSAGHPYAVASPSLAIASAQLERGPDQRYIDSVRRERALLRDDLRAMSFETQSSQANFVLARSPRAGWLRDGLAGLGIAVRGWPGDSLLQEAVRITCPGDAAQLARLRRSIATVLNPQALLFDMDGVLVDVRDSYRRAIIETAASFDVALSPSDIARAKARGNGNNDWLLTQRLMAERGCDVALEPVISRFEQIYQGGLWRQERLHCDRELLERLAGRYLLAVVTGRPRRDAERLLNRTGIADLFETVVCMEDAPAKPDPEPVALALRRLGVERAWMLGDTPDDMRAARAAGVMPLGLCDLGDIGPRTLLEAGAARVLPSLETLEEL